MTNRDWLVMCGRSAVASIAIMVLAFVGRPAPVVPTPAVPVTSTDSGHRWMRPATEAERLAHDLHHEWEMDQIGAVKR